jgi:DNA-directed RNA polymerase specialized sigma24 family protein
MPGVVFVKSAAGRGKRYLWMTSRFSQLLAPATLVALDECLLRLTSMDPRQCKVVELRYFLGLSVEEAAKTLETSERSVKRDWNLAKAWHYGELKEQHGIRPRTVARS